MGLWKTLVRQEIKSTVQIVFILVTVKDTNSWSQEGLSKVKLKRCQTQFWLHCILFRINASHDELSLLVFLIVRDIYDYIIKSLSFQFKLQTFSAITYCNHCDPQTLLENLNGWWKKWENLNLPCLTLYFLSASANSLRSFRKQFWNILEVYAVNSIKISNQFSTGTKPNALAIFHVDYNCSDTLSFPQKYTDHDNLSSKQNYH